MAIQRGKVNARRLVHHQANQEEQKEQHRNCDTLNFILPTTAFHTNNCGVRPFRPRSEATSYSAYLTSSNTPRISNTNLHFRHCNFVASLTSFTSKKKLTHFSELSMEYHVLAVPIEEGESSSPLIVWLVMLIDQAFSVWSWITPLSPWSPYHQTRSCLKK
jgi:hypothetical protein